VSPKAEGRRKKAEKVDLFEQILRRSLKPEARQRYEWLLLKRVKRHKAKLKEMLQVMNGHWTYEDHFYRYYHGSYKVYRTQTTTEQAVKLLRLLLPERELNLTFNQIIREGTGKEFKLTHNKNWDKHTRPMLEAFSHAKFMIEMAVRHADLKEPPQPMSSGYATLLYLYDLR
jgi:hypothetical protein